MRICPRCAEAWPDEAEACPTDGCVLSASAPALPTMGEPSARVEAVRPEPTDPLLHQTLDGRYRITRRVGEGGMGVVYEAEQLAIRKTVAVKVLHERHLERPEAGARLRNEARLASSIRNEHIVDIFDFGETADGRTFVVMELLDGESLAARLRREGPMNEAQLLPIATQVADAIGAAHERGIIHRDLKPENVFLVRREGADFVKVVDFGVSKATRLDPEEQRLTHTGLILGTPHYMSPEQARGEEHIDQRVDVYALGVILYEGLTGETPFRGSNYLGILTEVQHRPLLPPRELRPELRISADAERIVLRAMARDREARYPSMAALRVDLQRVLSGEPLEAGPALAPTTPATRPTFALAAIGLVTLVIVALAALALQSGAISGADPGAVGRPPVAAAPSPTPTPPTPAAVVPAAVPGPAPTALAAPAEVSVLVSSDPPGASILDGDRVLGETPGALRLPRSETPAHLRLQLEGYEDASLDVVALRAGEAFRVRLVRSKKRRAAEHPRESLPAGNPYR